MIRVILLTNHDPENKINQLQLVVHSYKTTHSLDPFLSFSSTESISILMYE